MSNTAIILKNGSGKPEPDSLQQAELAIDVASGDLYTKLSDDSIALLNDGGDSGSGTGSSVHIGENPPVDPEEGQQWMEVPLDGDATMWIYDGGKWLQQPGGKDGAAGADGNIADGTQDGIVATWDSTANSGAGQWTPNSSLTIDSGGRVGIGPVTSLNRALVVNDSRQAIARFEGTSGVRTIVAFSDPRSTNVNNQFIGTTGNDIFLGTANQDRLTIDATGDATFSGTVNVGDISAGSGARIYESGILYLKNSIAAESDALRVMGSDSSIKASITAGGDATFSGTVSANGMILGGNLIYNNTSTGHGIRFNTVEDNILPVDNSGALRSVGASLGNTSRRFKDAWFSGNIYKNGSTSPVIATDDLIKTLSTLRNATKDETTLEGLRDSIGNAIGGLIEEFENQIATMPVPEEPVTLPADEEPEAGTMDD